MTETTAAAPAPEATPDTAQPPAVVVVGAEIAGNYPMRELPIELITIDKDLQARVRLDTDHVEHLRTVIRAKQPRRGEPVVVFHYKVDVPDTNKKKVEGEYPLVSQDNYLLADGFHWIEAAKQEGKKKVEVQVREGGRSDALRYALGANAFHGKNRTTPDKERAIGLCLTNRKSLKANSNKEIARITQTSEVLVRRVREEWEALHPSEKDTVRMGKDGKPRGATQKVPASRQQAAEVKKAVENIATAKKPESIRVPEAGKTRTKGLVDVVGRPVPEVLAHVFKANVQFEGVIQILRNAAGAIDLLRKSGALAWGSAAIETNLAAALKDLTAAKPALVCPECEGEGCKLDSIKGTQYGYHPQAYWDGLSAAEKQKAVEALADEDPDAAEEAEELIEAAAAPGTTA